MTEPDGSRRGPLSGVKVVEIAHLVAGPMAGSLMADLGAQVVHLEAPDVGDAARGHGPRKDGHALWWKVAGRNKRSVTLDLRSERGRAVAEELVAWADVVITNFRVDTLRAWGLDWDTLHGRFPRLVMLHVSGSGLATGAANAPGFGKVGEARSGAVSLTGFAGGPPVHAGFSHADAATGLMGAFSICAALVDRHLPDFEGELIDLSLDEALFRLIDWQVIVADQLGTSPSRAGNQLAIAPAALVNTYETADERWVTVTSGTPRSIENISRLVGAERSAPPTPEERAAWVAELDAALAGWLRSRTADEALAVMRECEVVAAPVLTGLDILDDALFLERGNVVSVDDADLGPVRMHGVVPRLTQRPGAVWRPGAALGADTDLVLGSWLGHDAERIAQWREDGVV